MIVLRCLTAARWVACAFLFFIGPFALAQSSGLGPGPGGGTVPPNATMTFDDEFSNGSLDTTKWVPHYPWAAPLAGALEVDDPSALTFPTGGGLSIVANTLATPVEGQNYVSGCMTTYGTFMQTYGYFECKARLPKGAGLWPAFWLGPANQGWPPEIDVMENIGDAATIWTTYHWGVNGSDYQDSQGTTTGVDYSAGYHTYGVAWQPNSLIFYIDGVAVHTVTGSTVSSQPMYLMLDLAVGGSWPGSPNSTTPWPASFDVAWVHAYQYNSSPSVPATPVAFGPTKLSAQRVLPGGTISAQGSLILGTTGMTAPYVSMALTTFWGGANLPNTLAWAQPGVSPANSTTPFSYQYTVPASLTPGVYSVAHWVGDYTSGLSLSLPLAGRINVVAPETFAQWATGYSITNSISATPQNDGVPNLIKYVCDVDPTVPISTADRSALPTVGLDTTTTPGTTYLTLTYRQNLLLSGVTVSVQTSTDMQTWQTVTPDLTNTLSTDPSSGDPTMQYEIKTGSAPKLFARLYVTSSS